MTPSTEPLSATLLISCPDRRGLVAAVTDFIARHQGNILDLDQHVDAGENVFFMRVAWDLAASRCRASRSRRPSPPWPSRWR